MAVWDTSRDGSPPYAAYRATSAADGTYSVAVAPDEYFVCAGGIVGQAFRVANDQGSAPGPMTPADSHHVGECSGGFYVSAPQALEAWGTPFTVAAGSTATNKNLALDDPATISGTVRTADGAPLAGVTVTATDGPRAENHSYDVGDTATTNSAGRYTIKALAPGGPFCVGFNSSMDPAYSSIIWGSTESHCDVDSPHLLSSQPGKVHTGIDATLKRTASPLTNVSTPYFVGTPKVGYTLEGRPGTWSPAKPAVTYAWFDGTRALGTGATYVVKPAELGHTITVRATATAAGRAPTTVAWTKSDTVVAGTFWIAGNPTISGTLKVGKILTAGPQTSVPTGTRTYRWLRNGVAISGATKPTYKLAKADKGTKVSVRVYYSQAAYGSTSRTSSRTATIR